MAQLSYIDTGVQPISNPKFDIPTDESIGAFLFDISNFENPFNGFTQLYLNFKDGQIQRISNMDEALMLGIKNDGFLNNLVYYHLSQFFNYIEGDQVVYIAIADCSKDWDVLQYLQRQTNGRLSHIGIWTSQPIWNRKSDSSIGFTSLITDIQAQADEINGKVGVATHTMVPLHIILSGNSGYINEGDIDYKQLPNAIELNCPKVSVPLVQNGSEEVHKIQSNNPLNAPVGSLGLIMALLALCGAEESIASVETCDLNKNEAFNFPEWGVGSKYAPIDTIHRIWANIISGRGYIVPIDYEAIEASYYLSSDQTLCDGDFSSIANNRIMHKCRRVLCTALLPFVNGNLEYDPGTRSISTVTTSIISNDIAVLLSHIMKNKQGKQQIESHNIEFLNNSEVLEEDSLSIRLEITPVNYAGAISEDVSHDVNQ